MPHSYVKIWVHTIFSTKDRALLIPESGEHIIYQKIKDELRELECPVRNINGMPDHVHVLFLLCQQHALMDVLKQIKGATSHWINEQELIPEKFAWQTGYAAFSVSESVVARVDRYISNQKEHHRVKTFWDEYNEFLAAYGLLTEAGNG